MRLSAILVLISCIFSMEAFSQVRRGPGPGPGRGPHHRPMPPRYPAPMPRPMPRPMPSNGLACYSADLYNHNWLIHRFRWNNDCHQALRDVRMTGRFCDQSTMYDINGRLINHYRFESECRRALGWR